MFTGWKIMASHAKSHPSIHLQARSLHRLAAALIEAKKSASARQ